MSDLIDRQVAIDELQKEINKGIPPFDDVMGAIRCGVRLARNIIEDLPSAQPRWIPCSEKKPETMPKTNEDVLLQFSSNMGVGFYQDGWAVNTGEGIYSAVDMSEEKPIAWMPLPTPYGGDGDV